MCDTNACIEASAVEGNVHVRSTLNGQEIEVTREEWEAFLTAVKAGHLDDI